MHPIDYYRTVQQEREELLRQAEYERMIHEAKREEAMNQNVHRKFVRWLGIRMVMWGQKLESFGAPCKPYPSQFASPHH